MDFDALSEGYRKILRHIYEPRHYYQRVQTFLREYRPPKNGTPLDFQRLLAFFRCSLRLGIIGMERFEYWKLLSWSLLRRPKLFPVAITLAIYGHHFRKISALKIAQ
jgi:hypothetical protein